MRVRLFYRRCQCNCWTDFEILNLSGSAAVKCKYKWLVWHLKSLTKSVSADGTTICISIHTWSKCDEVPCFRSQAGFEPTISDCESDTPATRLTWPCKMETDNHEFEAGMCTDVTWNFFVALLWYVKWLILRENQAWYHFWPIRSWDHFWPIRSSFCSYVHETWWKHCKGRKSLTFYYVYCAQEDMICLSCTATSMSDGSTNGERVCLAAEGFGNRMCFLQSMANKVCSRSHYEVMLWVNVM